MSKKRNEKSIDKAVALRYDPSVDSAPKVIARGKGDIARRIINIARENQVPLYKDPELIDALLQIDLNDEVPEKLYRVIAEILTFVYNLDKEAWSDKN